MPRHVIRRDAQAARQLNKNSGGDSSQSVFCGRNCSFNCWSYPVRASLTAFNRSHDLPMLKNETSSIVATATQTAGTFPRQKINVENAASITNVNRPEPKNDSIQRFGA